MGFIDNILIDWSAKVDDGKPNIKNEQHLRDLVNVLVENNLPETFIFEFVGNLMEKQEKFYARNKDGKLIDFNSEEARDQAVKDKGYEKAGAPESEAPTKPDEKQTGGEDMLLPQELETKAKEAAKESEEALSDTTDELETPVKVDSKTIQKELGVDENNIEYNEDNVNQGGIDLTVYKDNPLYKTVLEQRKESTNKLLETLSSDIVDNRVKSLLNTTKNLLNISPEGTQLVPVQKTSTVFDTLLNERKSNAFRLELPAGTNREEYAKKLVEQITTQGGTAYVDSKPTHLTIQDSYGELYKIQLKHQPAGVKKPGQAQAYEAIAALRMALPEDVDRNEASVILTSLIETGEYTTATGIRVEAKDIAGVGLEWLRDQSNLPTAKQLLNELLSNPTLDEMRSMSEAHLKTAIEQGKYPKGTTLEIKCEGGKDTDEFRADVFVYAVTPSGEKAVIAGNSVKDGTNNQLGQLGQAKFRDVIEATEAGSKERIESLKSEGIQAQLNKLPEKIKNNIQKGLVTLEDPMQMGEMYADEITNSFTNDPSAMYDFMVFNLVGTDYPNDLQGYFYQSKDKVYGIPLPESEDSVKVKEKLTKAIKLNKIKSVGDNIVYVTNEGKEIPIMRCRAKIINQGGKKVLSRMLFEKKGGDNSIFMKLLTDPNFKLK